MARKLEVSSLGKRILRLNGLVDTNYTVVSTISAPTYSDAQTLDWDWGDYGASLSYSISADQDHISFSCILDLEYTYMEYDWRNTVRLPKEFVTGIRKNS